MPPLSDPRSRATPPRTGPESRLRSASACCAASWPCLRAYWALEGERAAAASRSRRRPFKRTRRRASMAPPAGAGSKPCCPSAATRCSPPPAPGSPHATHAPPKPAQPRSVTAHKPRRTAAAGPYRYSSRQPRRTPHMPPLPFHRPLFSQFSSREGGERSEPRSLKKPPLRRVLRRGGRGTTRRGW